MFNRPCKVCQSKDQHIKSLELQIEFFKQQLAPAPEITFPEYQQPPVLQPRFIVEEEPDEKPEHTFTPEVLLNGEY